ncbi:zinc-dependent alcohol dehydrogenase family protein [Streptomyces californicus]|uniref:zinc-dependent alcohol dehydrogenase family protein n=1 Tax=Streptomyces californicus TaxID=67351 RepID=UPI00368D7BFD
MRAIRFHRHGAPQDVLVLDDIPAPVPGPGELLVRVSARPVNPSDLLYVQGRYGRVAKPPATAGFEGVGRVEDRGEGCTVPVGARVAVAASGTWQEYVNIAESEAIPVPGHLPDHAACQLTINPIAARLLLQELQIPAGEWLLLSAGASAVARMIASLARRRGISCLHLVRRPEQARWLTGRGMEALVTEGDWCQRAQELTGGAIAAIDSVGGTVARDMALGLQSGGRLVCFGLLSPEPIPLAAGDLIFRGLNVCGFWLPQRLSLLTPEQRAQLFDDAVEDLAGALEETVPRLTYNLSQAATASAAALHDGHLGKVLLTG